MEEDIKVLEEMKKVLWVYFEDFKIDKDTSSTMKKIYETRKAQVTAIENLIKGYREYKKFYHRRLKEWRTRFENQEKHFLNELDEYDEEREKLKKQLENSIPKSKIKEKIEKLKATNTQDNLIEAIRNCEIVLLTELMEDK